MKTSLDADVARGLAERLTGPNRAFVRDYPGESSRRQPAHTVYIGAHTFHANTAKEHGELALAALREHAPDAATLANVIGLEGSASLASTVYERVVQKLSRDPVEDLRLDFEDGYGVRHDAEEDAHAVHAAQEMAAGMTAGSLPSFIGIRVKPLNEDVKARSLRTVDVFLSALLELTNGKLPPGFVLTLAKVTVPEQSTVFADLLDQLEPKLGLPSGALTFEIMIEVAQAVINARGETCVRALVDAGRRRCVAAHLGTYDYTASCNVTAAHQHMSHPACELAKSIMQASLAGTGVFVSDGSTNVLPVPTHASSSSSLTVDERAANRDAMHRAWRLHAGDIRRSLVHGLYQGWDLHPAQLPTRYAALYAFFLEALPRATERMQSFVERASHASSLSGVADDAATGQALLNFFLRGMSCGAITEEEARATGLTEAEMRGRSFPKILAGRRR